MNTHLDSIDRQIAAKHLLTHPFYLAWTRGELSLAALADYARQYYHHVAAFPTYLSAVHARCDDQPTRKRLLDNLVDEEAGSPNHPELWLQFAEGLGVSKEDVRASEKWDETSNLIGTFRSVCSEGTTRTTQPGFVPSMRTGAPAVRPATKTTLPTLAFPATGAETRGHAGAM